MIKQRYAYSLLYIYIFLQKQEHRVKKIYTLQKSQHSVLKNILSNIFVSLNCQKTITNYLKFLKGFFHLNYQIVDIILQSFEGFFVQFFLSSNV